MTFFYLQRVWKTVKCQGKIREKSVNFEVDDKWQPCNNCIANIHRQFCGCKLCYTVAHWFYLMCGHQMKFTAIKTTTTTTQSTVIPVYNFRKDPTISLNYAVFLYNNNDKKMSTKQFSQFESKIRVLKGNQNPANSDPEVISITL